MIAMLIVALAIAVFAFIIIRLFISFGLIEDINGSYDYGIFCNNGLKYIRLNSNLSNQNHKPFDVSEYAKRREKFLLEIEKERQSEPKYYITLWFGLNGLREQEDGKYKCVNRTPQNTSFTPTFSDSTNVYWSENCVQQVNTETFESFRNRQMEQMVQSNQASIDDLRNRMSNLQRQATQQELNQQIVNAVYYPQYLRTNIYPVYQYMQFYQGNPACYVSTPCISVKTER